MGHIGKEHCQANNIPQRGPTLFEYSLEVIEGCLGLGRRIPRSDDCAFRIKGDLPSDKDHATGVADDALGKRLRMFEARGSRVPHPNRFQHVFSDYRTRVSPDGHTGCMAD